MLKTKIINEMFEELIKVEQLSLEAFPPEEYLAPSKIIEVIQDGDTEFLALYDEELFVGFVVLKKYKTMCYLFFLVIDPTHRSKGYGAETIKAIKELYPNCSRVVDFEMVDETKENNNQRIKRRKFYLKNEYKPTNHFFHT